MPARHETELDRLVVEATARHRAGDLAASETAWLAALALAPGRAQVLHNLGVVVAAQGRHAEALALFDRALAAEPGYATAQLNRAAALDAMGRRREAIEAYHRAATLDPGSYEAHQALGFGWLAEGRRDRALDHFARTYELRRGEDRTGIARFSLDHATGPKIAHDAAQFRYLAVRRRDGKRFEMLARAYDIVARTLTDTPARLDDEQLDMLGEDYNTAIHVRSAPEMAGGAINPDLPTADLVRRFRGDKAGAVAFDGLLTEPALAALNRFLLESTIWHDFGHIGGFVASYLEDGLAAPLVLQIADEIRQRFSDLLSSHPLVQAWAFKGLTPESTVAAHADDGVFSVNFWVTPDAANLEPGRGGLEVCRAPPPADWQISGYEADRAAIDAFIDAHEAETLVVPYAQNRAVLFQSRLFHRSNTPHFAPGYDNHRINVTLVYGRHGT